MTKTALLKLQAARELFDDAGASQYLLTTPRTLRLWRAKGLPFIKLSARSLRYRRCDLDAWLSSHRVAVRTLPG
jgi:hypothetical protein